MDFQHAQAIRSRREFLTTSASGLGGVALASLLANDGLMADEKSPSTNPLAPKPPHFAPKAKRCIFIQLAGAPSHIDLYDHKPVLNERNGQKLPESLTEKVRFAFIKKESALLMGSPQKFERYGKCGMELSTLLPHIGSCADDIALIRSMHTDAFNHHPAQLMLTAGVPRFGRPSFGSWLNYGLGSESENLPGFVVLTAGRGSSGGVSNWTSGFLSTTYQGVPFRSQGEPVLNLNNPPGISPEIQAASLAAVNQLNQKKYESVHDPEIAARIASYELAFRMQSAAPELIDLSQETQEVKDAYGVDRKEPEKTNFRGGGANVYKQFSTNCLLARRLVERGVRFVTLVHASWDHHSNLAPEIGYNAGMLDQPVGALIKDLKDRGMLDDTLVICAGEFGRTPLGENRGGKAVNTGRDHHPYAFSLWMAGGGIKGGTVLGETDEIGWAPVEDPVHMNDFHATIMHQFGLDHLKVSKNFKGLDVRLTDQGGQVLKKIIS
ncbi:MAG: sulfatase [Blastopirellula sp.]|nr:MAG: sulfatase [Blastopirellula sp.]